MTKGTNKKIIYTKWREAVFLTEDLTVATGIVYIGFSIEVLVVFPRGF